VTVLVIGGTGTTGSRVAAALRGQRVAVRVTSRRPTNGQIHFEWADPHTHADALDGVRSVYLVAPVGVADPAQHVAPFLDLARERGVRRVVLLSSSAVPEGAPGLGELHRMVRASVPEPTVLRPSWFMQNFLGDHPHAQSARTDGEIVTATGGGRVAFVDAGDIAAVAAHALSDAEPHVGEYVLTGPEALSYAEAAAVLTEVTGPAVRHRAVGVAELTARFVAAGYPPDFSALLAGLDADIARGVEDRTTSAVQDVTGRLPRSFREVVGEAHLPAGVAP
jgi:uncharacterized protein YbjT (DUF2867 family)